MSRWEFKLPDIGEGVTEGEVVSWLVKPGDVVKEDQPMVEIMTDKATVTITAPKAGRITETTGKVGEIVKVHGVLVVFDVDGGTPAAAATPKGTNGTTPPQKPKDDGPAATAVGDIREELPGMRSASAAPPGYFNQKPLATPATRKLARDLNIDLQRVPPSGPQGRVTKSDLEKFRSPSPSLVTQSGGFSPPHPHQRGSSAPPFPPSLATRPFASRLPPLRKGPSRSASPLPA